MKIKFRPFTALLLVLLLLAGVCAVLFHTGFFDAFLAEKSELAESTQLQGEEGPVVRREVRQLVLPLESSRQKVSGFDQGLNEADISAGNQSGVQVFTPVAKDGKPEQNEKFANVEKSEAKSEPVPKSKAKKVTKKTTAKSAEKSAAKGVLSKVSVVCEAGKASIDIRLSNSTGKISWFNLANPRKFVVDFHGKWQNRAKSLYRLKDCPVQKIVLGEHPAKVRMVFYLDEKSVPANITPVVRRLDKKIFIGLNF